MSEDTCRIYDDGEGNPVRIRGGKPLDEQGQAAMRELLAAARRRHEAEKAAERAEIARGEHTNPTKENNHA